MLDWFDDNEMLVVWMFVASAITFLVSLVVVSFLIVRMPPDYFSRRGAAPDSFRGRHPAIRWAAVVAKNIFGLILVFVGIALSLPGIPGQGLLTVLIGVSLLNFPGKRRLELRIVRTGPVLKAINWIRAKYDRPPLELPPKGTKHGEE